MIQDLISAVKDVVTTVFRSRLMAPTVRIGKTSATLVFFPKQGFSAPSLHGALKKGFLTVSYGEASVEDFESRVTKVPLVHGQMDFIHSFAIVLTNNPTEGLETSTWLVTFSQLTGVATITFEG